MRISQLLTALLCAAVLGAGCARDDDKKTSVAPGSPGSGPLTPKVDGLKQLAEFSRQQVTGVTVGAGGRIFVNFPRWRDGVANSVVEIMPDGTSKAFPNAEWNAWDGEAREQRFTSVQSVVARGESLFVLDTANPQMKGIQGRPRLYEFSLDSNSLVRSWAFDPAVAPSMAYLNDFRFSEDGKTAFITDSGLGALVVLSLDTGVARRVLDLHPSTKAEVKTLVVNGKPFVKANGQPQRINSDGIALRGADLYFHALTGYHLYRVPLLALMDPSLTPESLGGLVEDLGVTPATDGMIFDKVGNLYMADLEKNAIVYRTPAGELKTLLQDPAIHWPDTFAIDAENHLVFTDSFLDLAVPGRPAAGIFSRVYRVPLPAQNAPAGEIKGGKTTPVAPVPKLAMKEILDELAALGGKPIETLAAPEARIQPTASDAVRSLLSRRGRVPDDLGVTDVHDIVIPGPAGNLDARVFDPGVEGAKPLVVFFHGGGFVIADLETYEGTARVLAKGLGALVISVDYRRGPEAKFPAAHDDAFAAYKWIVTNAARLGGDPAKIAVAGESAGGNLALNVALRAREENFPKPVHVLAIYPIAGGATDTESYVKYADAKPLNKPMMEWFFTNALGRVEDRQDPRINLLGARLADLPPTTLIAAEVDPLRTEVEQLAGQLKGARVPTELRLSVGVAHEFFGLGDVLVEAKAAQDFAIGEMKKSFDGALSPPEVPVVPPEDPIAPVPPAPPVDPIVPPAPPAPPTDPIVPPAPPTDPIVPPAPPTDPIVPPDPPAPPEDPPVPLPPPEDPPIPMPPPAPGTDG